MLGSINPWMKVVGVVLTIASTNGYNVARHQSLSADVKSPVQLPRFSSFETSRMTQSSLNKYSSRVTQPKSQGASQAMLYGTGMTEADMDKAQVGIASVWYEGNTCNMHLHKVADRVKEGLTESGLVGMRFNTIGVSDGISMGTEGMSFSLQSRDLIADSIETIMGGQWYDGLVALPGCDKNMPGCLIAMGRLNRPALMVYGGTIKPGRWGDESLDIVSAFQCYGQYLAGSISEDERREIVRRYAGGYGYPEAA